MNRSDFKKYQSTAIENPKYQGKVIEVNLDNQVRCPHCNCLFFKGDFKGAIQIKCPVKECKKITTIKQL